MPMNTDKQFVEPGEAARLLGVSIWTIQRWDKAGKINAIRTPGNRRRIPMTEVERIIEEGRKRQSS